MITNVSVIIYRHTYGTALVCVGEATLAFTPQPECYDAWYDWDGVRHDAYVGEPEDSVKRCVIPVGGNPIDGGGVFSIRVERDPSNGTFIATMENRYIAKILKDDWKQNALQEGNMTFEEMQEQYITAGCRDINTSTSTIPGIRSRFIHLAVAYRTCDTPPPNTPSYAFMFTVDNNDDDVEPPEVFITCKTYEAIP